MTFDADWLPNTFSMTKAISKMRREEFTPCLKEDLLRFIALHFVELVRLLYNTEQASDCPVVGGGNGIIKSELFNVLPTRILKSSWRTYAVATYFYLANSRHDFEDSKCHHNSRNRKSKR
jgi:hypothetical protein